ncbi:MAG: hypothetical protein C0614_05835 [Desulfuromonas sp.]|nr:MAG: hypothetical protein C0614_05835 [Desulfuromonas sp.]
MAKRNQVNVTLDDLEMSNVNEYCRVHGMTPQGFFKAGARRLIQEDILEQRADLMTLQSWGEVEAGLSEPVDDLLQMIEDDRNAGREMLPALGLCPKR